MPREDDLAAYGSLLAALPDEVRALVDRAMDEPQRRYHARWHLGRLWRLAGRHARTDEMPLLAYMVGFHDIVYDVRVRAPVNEQASARAFLDACRAGLVDLDGAGQESCHAAILASADHLHARDGLDPTGRLFLDLDLEPMASEFFDDNTDLLREEFSWLDDEAWEKGRRHFLGGVLATAEGGCPIYGSGRVPPAWEAAARDNLRRNLPGHPSPS